MTCKEARETLQAAMRDDPAYAWSWHCNIAMCVKDEGVDHAIANRAAKRFMKLAFDIETKEPGS